MRKRILSILLTLCMVLCLAPMAAFAEGSTASADITGTGTADDPYLIYTAEGLKQFGSVSRDAHAKLMNDIVLNDGTFDDDGNYTKGASGKDAEQWTPINNNYAGIFDGDGHTIQGLYVVGGTFVGLFHTLYGTVKNLTVTGYVSGTDTAGGIASQGGTFENCVNQCRVIAKHGAMTEAWAGGIVGYSGTVQNCVNMGRITGCSGYGVAFAGGLVGQGSATDCYNVGKVDGSGGRTLIGGITGHGGAENCYWLEGTAEKAIGSSGGVAANTKADFADGTVLKLLQNGDANSPWAKTGYLAAAKMTLPLLNRQTADTHEHSAETGSCCTNGIYCECGYLMHMATSGHNWGKWQHLTTSHSRRCDNPGCGMTQSENCSGGTATCSEQATCEVCGGKYGNKDPNNHSYEWTSENGEYWQHCTRCGLDLDKKAIPEIVINGGDRVCRTQDYKFSFTLPEGVVSAQAGYGFTLMGSDVPLTEENGVYTGVVKAEWYDENESSFVLSVYAQTADEFAFSVEKTVAILNEHTGGIATCTEKAVCEVCGESYGELNASNHSDLKHFDAKAATETAEGNIEYWFCEGCGKYFADKEQTREITQADTVTAKLPATPKTGDESRPVLWMTLLVISGGAAILCRRRRTAK